MDLDTKDLPKDRPSSFDKTGRRLFLQPGEVKGKFRTLRNITYWFLIFVFLVLPWTEYDGHQSILLSLTERKFTFFGLTFWAHDAPLVFFPLIISTLGLTLVTAIWGRLWCGWACPQTVFLDAIFRKIEKLTEGDYLKRIKLNKQPWSAAKVVKKTVKWALYTAVSLHIAHSFIAYFVGAKNLVWISLSSPADNWTLFIIVQSLAAVLLFNFAWFREQFCIIMCPYGRFQSVLMGRNSLSVLYDVKRGEPRKSVAKSKDEMGDCVNCFRCVNVCPTGIDIRNGVQMECVACTACIDACDEIMEKVKKPKGLIRYSSENEISGLPRRILTFRTGIYSLLISILVAVFIGLVVLRDAVDFKLLRAIEAPYTIVPSEKGEMVVNHFRLHISNHSQVDMSVQNIMAEDEKFSIVAPTLPLKLEPGKQTWVHFFIKTQRSTLSQDLKTNVVVSYSGSGKKPANQTRQIEVSFLGPARVDTEN